MCTLKPRLLAIAVPLLLPLVSISGQTLPVSGLYRIVSGKYRECCGFIGSGLVQSLPTAEQSYIRLTVDPQSGTTAMDFLGADQQTVFRRIPCLPDSTIDFAFPFGFLIGTSLVFHVDPGPPPNGKYWNYTASNSAAGLRIDGLVGTALGGCADTLTQFGHSNLVAVLIQPPTMSVLGFSRDHGTRLFVQAAAGETTIIETSADLTHWSPISTNVMDSSVCPICPYVIFEDADSTNLTHRFYRVYKLPSTQALAKTSPTNQTAGQSRRLKPVPRSPRQLRTPNLL